MRFRIKYQEQIVGILSFFGIAVLIFVIFLLGSNKRWFNRDYHYTTVLNSGAGISKNMSVMHKGFKIGSIESFDLNRDDNVDVKFTIYDTYNNYVKEGSLVELQISPIGLGNQFIFYPGRGSTQLPENALVPLVNSAQAINLIEEGLADIPRSSDSITILITRLNTLLEGINNALAGDDTTSLGRSFLGVEDILQSLKASLLNIENLSAELASKESPFHTNLESSLSSLSGILTNLNKSSEYLPSDMPQITAMIVELRESLMSAEDLLQALLNNPLLKNGVPKRANTQSSAIYPRNTEF